MTNTEHFSLMEELELETLLGSGPLSVGFQAGYTPEDYDRAGRDASLGVGHIWWRVACPAYRTYAPADCTCGQLN